MEQTTTRLTPAQQKIAEENSNLIYWFAHTKNISIDEHYGDLAIALCNAARIYDPSKGAFSTIAKQCFERAMSVVYRYEGTQKRTCEQLVYYDNTMQTKSDDDNDVCFLDALPSDINLEDEVITQVDLERFYNTLSDDDKRIVTERLNGKKFGEIAESLNRSRYYVTLHKDAMLKKWRQLH